MAEATRAAAAAALAWWAGICARSGAAGLAPPGLPEGALGAEKPDRGAAAFGQDLVRHPPVAAAAALGEFYASLLPAGERTAAGVFYTPPPLASRLADQASAAGADWRGASVADPACGAGALLVQAALRMADALPGETDEAVIGSVGQRLRGWDTDPFAAWLAQICVEGVLIRYTAASGRRLPRMTETRDSLSSPCPDEGAFGVVIGNPPFGRTRPDAAMKQRFGRVMHGHPNLYALFTDLSVRLSSPGGVVALVTPTSYLSGAYFKALRGMLRREAAPVSVDIVESRTGVFGGVLQEVALSVFRKGAAAAACRTAAVRCAGGAVSSEDAGYAALPADPEAPWIVPRSASDAHLVSALARVPGRLSDLGYKVSTGPLVWNRHRSGLAAEAAPGSVPVIWAEAVTQNCSFSLRSERPSHRSRAWFAPTSADDPNVVRAPCVLVQRTTGKEQRRRLVCAPLPTDLLRQHGGAAVENHLNMIIPARRSPSVSIETLAAFLATRAADRVLRCISGSAAVSASELEAMPLPDADTIRRAAAAGDPETAALKAYTDTLPCGRPEFAVSLGQE